MEWSARWDCENLIMFSSKPHCETQKKLQLTELETGEGSGGSDSGSAIYGSEAQKIYSTMCSSPSNFKNKNMEVSAGSAEALIGLKLGKKTYFDNKNVLSSSSIVPKRIKQTSQVVQIPHCQVEGCNLNLSLAKKYHQKHRVCDKHSKSPMVIVGGAELRFCQQCSRFHGLSEFDAKKRSCRRRLSQHNARRRNNALRKINEYDSTRLSSSFYDEQLQMSVLNQFPTLVPSKTAANSTWETHGTKFTIGQEFTTEPEKSITTNTLHGNAWNWPVFFNQGTTAKVSMLPSNVSTSTMHEFAGALSLLSTPSQGSLELKPIVNHEGFSELIPHPQPLPLYWEASNGFHGHNNGGFFPEFQMFRAPCETDFYFSPLK